MNEAKQGWPVDAVMIVCATPGEARREVMESAHPGRCRDCGREVVYDGRTLRRAMEMPERHGRPVLLFCVACAVARDFRTITLLEDHRK